MHPASLLDQLQGCIGGVERKQQGKTGNALHRQNHNRADPNPLTALGRWPKQ
jgi:hypothetical protein